LSKISNHSINLIKREKLKNNCLQLKINDLICLNRNNKRAHMARGITHSTNDELLFLDAIGKHVESDKDEFKDERVLLKKYIKAASLRKDWNGMSKEVIIKHANFLLNKG